MTDFKIETKTYLIFALLGLVAAMSSGIIFISLHDAKSDAEIVNALGRQRMLSQAMAKYVLNSHLTQNSEQGNIALANYQRAKEIYRKTLTAARHGGHYPLDLKLEHMGFMPAIDDVAAQAKIIEVDASFEAFTTAVDQFLAAEAVSTDQSESIARLVSRSDQLLKISNDLVTLYTEIANHNNTSIFVSTLGLLVVTACILIFSAVYFKLSVIGRINDTLTNLQNIARGERDLTHRLNDSSSDELGQLAHAFNQFIDKIHDLIKRVAQVTEELSVSANHSIHVANQSSAAVFRQQKASEKLAIAIAEMSATVSEVAKNAASAENETQNVNQSMHSGLQIVNQTVHDIQELAREVDQAVEVLQTLESQSDRIGSVLDVIKNIAEQTNLLALNAAIEAARAGDQGRGFAVVADEVRTLATRTQESTSEIQAMIESLQSGSKKAVKVMYIGKDQVAQCVAQSNAAGKNLTSINDSVINISSRNAQIANATEQQSATAEEINHNIQNISTEATATSEYAQQVFAVNEELQAYSNELKKLVSQFKLG